MASKEQLIIDHEAIIYHLLHKTKFWNIFPEYREDFLQEGRMAIVKAIETYNGRAKLSTYAYTLVRNAIYDYANTMKLHYQYATLPLNESSIPSTNEINLDAYYVMQMINKDEHKQWLRDYFLFEMTQEEIAENYDTNQQNVSRVIVDFRNKMRKEFEDEEEK
jgi:RNA polymerase sigma factor (sigma-70 family)